MEYRKFIQRPIKNRKPITSFKMNKILCQDAIYTIATNDVEVQGLKFSKAFFYDFNDNVENQNLDDLYVLDGVAHIHKLSNSNLPLVRDRALYTFLYLEGDLNLAYLNAIATNPWLDDLSNRSLRFMSHRAIEIKNTILRLDKTQLYSNIIDHLDTGFTPRGRWGLDYVFKWKHPHQEPLVQVTPDIRLVPFREYINYFEE